MPGTVPHCALWLPYDFFVLGDSVCSLHPLTGVRVGVCTMELLLRTVWLPLMAKAPKGSYKVPCWDVMQTPPSKPRHQPLTLTVNSHPNWEDRPVISGTALHGPWVKNMEIQVPRPCPVTFPSVQMEQNTSCPFPGWGGDNNNNHK